MSERDQRRSVIKGLRPIHAVPIESPATGSGIPDVNFADGWIELKWLRAWPARESTVVHLDHFTQQQRIWLRKRAAVSPNVWLLLQCRREWLLFSGKDAAWFVGNLTRDGLYGVARRVWRLGMNYEELIECLIPEELDL